MGSAAVVCVDGRALNPQLGWGEVRFHDLCLFGNSYVPHPVAMWAEDKKMVFLRAERWLSDVLRFFAIHGSRISTKSTKTQTSAIKSSRETTNSTRTPGNR